MMMWYIRPTPVHGAWATYDGSTVNGLRIRGSGREAMEMVLEAL